MESSIQNVYSLTGLQSGIYYSRLKNSDSNSYHLQTEIEIDSQFSEEQIKTALQMLSYQYEMLRTAIVLPESTGIPRQVILAERTIPLKILTVADRTVDQIIDEYKEADLHDGFDLQKESLIRVAAVLEGSKSYFVISVHHIILDGWSLKLLLQSFVALLYQVQGGQTPEQICAQLDQKMKSVPKFDEYVHWTENLDKNKAYEFWSKYLENADVDSEIHAQFNTSEEDQQSKTITGSISKEKTSILLALSSREGFTLNTIAEAAWGIVLQKYNCTTDAVFSRILSGREVPLPNAEKIFGILIHSIPCRVCSDDNDTMTSLCSRLYDADLQAMEYSNVSLSDIQEQCDFHVDRIHTIVAFENYTTSDDVQHEGFRIRQAREQTEYPISVSYFTEDEQLCFNIIYDCEKYSAFEMEILKNVLSNVLSYYAEHTDCRISDISFQDSVSYQIIQKARVKEDFDASKSIIDYLQYWAETTPDKTAVDCYGQSVTYGRLWEMAQCIAAELHEKGLQHGECVVISSQKRIEVIAAIYGVFLAGGVCTIVSDEYPLQRQEYIFRETDAKFSIYHKNKFDVSIQIPTICIDAPFFDRKGAYRDETVSGEDIAHIIFTSGTTGQAKGVCLKHNNLLNTLMCNSKLDFHLDTDTVLMHVNAQTFDASLFEIHGCLINGGRLVLVEKNDFLDASRAKQIVSNSGINTIMLPTAFFNQVAYTDPTVFNGVKYLGFGGELCNLNCINRVLENNRGITIYNIYGPTETAIYVTSARVVEVAKKVNIGKPLRNTDIYILNGMQPCSIGMCGELCIGGPQVGAGYLHQGKVKNNGFVENPFAPGLMYRTGDFACWAPDSSIDYIGRTDNQIKLRGYRIELNEVENALRNTQGVMSAAVKFFKKDKNDGTMVAYYKAESFVTESSLRQSLEAVLPRYSVPSVFVKMEQFPLNKNGKIDMAELKEPERKTREIGKAPVTDVQRELCTMIAETLGLEAVGIDEDIFVLGCDSLKAMKLLATMKHKGYQFVISNFYRYRTVEKMSEHLIVKKEIDAADSKQNCRTFETIDDVKSYLDEAVAYYENNLVFRRDVEIMPLLSNQLCVAGQATIMSGVVISFEEEFNIDVLTESVLHLFNTQSILRTTIRNNLLVYKAKYQSINIPYLNLKNASQDLKRQVCEYLTTSFYTNEHISTVEERALHRIVAVKYSETACKLYIPIDHMIFDAVSGEIVTSEILRHYYDIDAVDNPISSYQEYANQLALGPVNVKKRDLLEQFRLKEFASALSEYAKLDDGQYKNYVIELNLGRSTESFTKEELWNYAYRLFLKMVHFSIKAEKIPFVVVCINREYCEKMFYNTVGLFVDSIPFVDIPDGSVDYDTMRDRIKWLSDHNISAISMISGKRDMMKFPKIGATMLSIIKYVPKLPVFNYLGLYTAMTEVDAGIQVEELLKKEKQVIRTVDIKVKANSFSILAFCREGQNQELQSYLQNCLNEMIDKQNKDGGDISR